MLASIEEVVNDEKSRKSIIDLIKQIPISDTSNMRRVESLALDIFEILLDKLRKAEMMSLAVDESADNSDVAQLCLYVRFFGECFHEDLLGLIPMEGHTTSEIIFTKIASFLKENNMDLACINILVTDGAPLDGGHRSVARQEDGSHGSAGEISTLPHPPKPPVCQTQWWVKRDHGLCHGNYKLYPLYLQFSASPFLQAVDWHVCRI